MASAHLASFLWLALASLVLPLSPCTVRQKLLWPDSLNSIGQVRGLTSRLQGDEEGLQHCRV